MTEYLAENARLRQVARRHAEGQIALADYRAARREILDALEAGRVEAVPAATDEAAAPVPVVAEAVLPETLPPSVPVAAPVAVPAVSWDGHTRILAAVLGLALLLALGALFYVFAL